MTHRFGGAPTQLHLGDKMQRLALLAPDKLRAIETLVDLALHDAWPRGPQFKADEAQLRLMAKRAG